MLRRLFAENILYQRFPVAYAHYYYWRHTGRELNLKNPQGISQKMLWLACFWQDSRIVRCTDKLAVREYIIQCGLEDILNEIYFIYDNAADIDITKLPSRFVLKTNHFGGGDGVFICKNKKTLILMVRNEYWTSKCIVLPGWKHVSGSINISSQSYLRRNI